MFSKPSGVTGMIVFLGNPGKEYAGSRHNAGFMTADFFEKQQDVKINRLRFRSLTGTCTVGGKKLLLMKPQTYMNLSGEAVRQAVLFYRIPPENVLVISDEMSLPVGKIRFRTKGSAGGHNGLKNIIGQLGTEDFPRIRLGVGAPPHPDYDVKDWVLSGFTGRDAEEFSSSAERAAQAAAFYFINGAEKTMNRFNCN